MVESRERRRAQRRERAVSQFGAEAETALSVLQLLDLAWDGTYGEPATPSWVMDDIWCVAEDIPRLVAACNEAVVDYRDLRMWADQVRAGH